MAYNKIIKNILTVEKINQVKQLSKYLNFSI